MRLVVPVPQLLSEMESEKTLAGDAAGTSKALSRSGMSLRSASQSPRKLSGSQSPLKMSAVQSGSKVLPQSPVKPQIVTRGAMQKHVQVASPPPVSVSPRKERSPVKSPVGSPESVRRSLHSPSKESFETLIPFTGVAYISFRFHFYFLPNSTLEFFSKTN